MAKYPSIKLLIPFVIGIISGMYINWLIVCSGLSILFLIGLVIPHTSVSVNYKRWAYSFKYQFILMACGFGLISWQNYRSTPPDINLSGYHSFVGVIQELPKIKNTIGAKTKLIATDERVFTDTYIQLYISTLSELQIHPGDTVIADAYFFPQRPNKNPYAFDYSKFLKRKGIWHSASIKNDFSIKPGKNIPLSQSIAWGLRIDLLNRLKQLVASDTYDIASALLLGSRNSMDEETQENFKNVGAIHVLAVSGLHVGIIVGLFHFILLRLPKNWKTTRISIGVFIILFLILFSELTGSQAPVRRASLMFAFLLSHQLFKSKYHALNVLALSAIILLVIDPEALFDVGFQLSFAAVASIICFYPIIYKSIFIKNWFIDKVWQLTSVSLAAQIFTYPITMHYFNQFPLLFILSSIIAIAVAFVVIYTGLASLVVSYISFDVAKWGGVIIDKSISFLKFTIAKMASWDHILIENIWLPSSEALLLLAGMIFVTIYIYYKKSFFLQFGLICIATQLGLHSWQLYKNLDQEVTILYDTSYPLMDIFIGRTCYTLQHPDLQESDIYYASSAARIVHRIDSIVILDYPNYSLE